ncbi:MAG: hypothetical protein JSC189_001111 [Candidatus Tokpelaia sp. JSC189]|nr:MAG: hypothetical protein JSC189_001111 [Candidatus Tokpelaia sp. JSC189]
MKQTGFSSAVHLDHSGIITRKRKEDGIISFLEIYVHSFWFSQTLA